ncbi:hypothetical protein [Natranaerobius thermophilus]|uniref:hypothetical protein n=1 Tax=Natranaerobius thermophilus TaxID=375929 RepID=UPI0002D7752C|nr:hypothetical protein [Natranaerobius thermophilus]
MLVGIAELLIIAFIIGAAFFGRRMPQKIAKYGKMAVKAGREFNSIRKIFKIK